MSPPQSGTAGLRGFRAIWRSGPCCRGRRFSVASQVDAGCQPKRATHHRCYRHSRTRGACRSRLGVLPAHKASRARPPPKTMRTVGKVVNPPSRPLRPVPALPVIRPLLLESVALQYPACRDTLRMQHTIKSLNACTHRHSAGMRALITSMALGAADQSASETSLLRVFTKWFYSKNINDVVFLS